MRTKLHFTILYTVAITSLVISLYTVFIRNEPKVATERVKVGQVEVGKEPFSSIVMVANPTLLNDRDRTETPSIQLFDTTTGQVVAELKFDHLFGASIELRAKSGERYLRLGFDNGGTPCLLLGEGRQGTKYVFRKDGRRLILEEE